MPYQISYPTADDKGNFLTHPSAGSVVGIHNVGWMFVQATVAILILVGFESVTSLGGEAKNAKRDVPIAVITSLLVQGCFCYLFEYFAANYFLNSGYTMQSCHGLGGAHRRHDDRRRRCVVWPGPRPDVHADRGHHRVSGSDRHDALLHQHRRPRDLRDGQRPGSAGTLRHAPRQKPQPPPRHLDAGDHLRGHWLHRAADGVRRFVSAHRRRGDRGVAARALVQRLVCYYSRPAWRPSPTR